MDDAKSGRLELRASKEFLARIDAWRKRQDNPPTRSQAVREIVDQVLLKRTK